MSNSPAPSWHRRPDDRPGEIVAAALEVFAERGLSGARMEEVAERARISKGTIYLYFESKDDLFRAAVRHAVEPFESLARVEQNGSAEDRLRAVAYGAWEGLRTREFQSVYRLVLGELHRFPELARFYSEQASGQVSDRLAQIVQSGIDRGEFRTQDPAASARMLVALLLAHALWRDRRSRSPLSSELSDAEVFEQVLDFYLIGLGARGVGARAAGGAAGEAAPAEGAE